MEHESDVDTSCNWYTCYSHQRVGTRTGRLGNKKAGGDYLNYSIVEIGQNTEQSPGYCYSDSNEKPSANLEVKKSQKSKIMIMMMRITNNLFAYIYNFTYF